jgi:hypothetical protein
VKYAIMPLAVLAVAVAYACTITDELTLMTPGPKGPSCGTTIPERPQSTGGSVDGAADLSFKVAIESAEVSSDGTLVGINLDNLCTCPDEAACKGVMNARTCDTGDAGIDNASAAIFQAASFSYDAIENFNENFKKGTARGVVVLVEGYNGKSNDEAVSVSVFGSTGVVSAPPKFTEADVWKIDRDTLLFRDSDKLLGKISIADGYVRDDVLYATTSGYFTLAFDVAFKVSLTPVTMIGKLGKTGNGSPTMTELTIAGRWSGDDIYRAVGGAKVLGTNKDAGVFICTDPESTAILDTISGVICAGLDLPGQGGDSQSSCKFASFGMKAKTKPANFGTVFEQTNAVPYPCSDAGLTCP